MKARSLALIMVAAAAAGCGQTVEVKYVLPPAAPLGGTVSRLRLVSLQADPPAGQRLGEIFRRTQAQCLRGADSAPSAGVTAHVWTEVTDHTQPRQLLVRHRGTTQQQAVPALVRTVRVRAVFGVAADGGGRADIELRHQWKSMGDPRVRGPNGLHRPDDPSRVPDVDVVTEELFALCVKELCDMLAPVEMTASVPRRVVWPFERDSVNARFNETLELERRAAAEQGDLTVVLERYRRLLDGGGDDEELRQAVHRVEHAREIIAAARPGTQATKK
ncbi:MAG: hypothetical protein ABFD92_03955 [Planctomycetaceae bacterium]|nr:hypothetical protein [Planctomycetaceae bacterium]